ncbi:restriction endonuclease subunit S [Bradyrhizobium sp. AUGA SZCCT0274]|uniref:restriction endonuclease subunit S n=1 Tax=unclassified Bradyrhizobium TaxID=2631580 RepID=UPI001BAD22A9|nr:MULTISPECIES: restriction endonuclease subunit S [unclassified Bradyrhizobium]MBR1199885.1 restriction endonuclease subunit S [Bradyrhizobium sp. AUGA SZCCT0158]MBR1242849.1 restriction endonuclease subunit S [Bradyrhizobium sp. AUGA SZCCT0274]
MNAKRLLAHYEQIADAPDAIAHLRRFILNLAVRGKLVQQDSTEEPASELLKRIANEKARLDRKERTKRESRNLIDDAEPVVLPKGWALAPLADLVTVLNGRAYKQHELLSAGMPVLRVGNLFTSDRWYYSTLQLEEDKYCDKGDLIFAWSASFGPFIWSGEKVIYHYHIWKLPLHSEADLNKLYLYNFLLQKTREIKEAGHGISMIHMTKEKMELIQVPLPPLAEQHRIVAKIDELMALCDQLEAARATREAVRDRLAAASLVRLNAPECETFQVDGRFALDVLPALTARPDQIKLLRQTILNLAVRGKLVTRNAEDEPAAELVKRIAKEKLRLLNAGEIKKEKAVDLITSENQPFDLPQEWSWVRLDSLSRLITKGSSPKWQGVDYVNADEGILFITSENVGNQQLRKLDDLKYVESRFRDIEPRSMLKRGDILMNLVGASIGRTAVYDLDLEANINQAVALVRLVEISEGPLVRYLLQYFNSPAAIDFMLGSRVITAQPNMSLADARKFPIPLPPLAEQHRIVAKVDTLMALCDQLEASLAATAATRRRLLEALLAEALAPTEARKYEAAE